MAISSSRVEGSVDFDANAPGKDAPIASPASCAAQWRLRVLGLVAFSPVPATATPPASPTAPRTGPAVVSELMRPFPVVRIKGRVTGSGARIDLLSVRAPKDATIRVRCRGRSCPARVRARVGGPARISELHRALAAGTVVTVRVTRPENYGKYARFVIRRHRPPARTDSCLRGSARRPVRCPAA